VGRCGVVGSTLAFGSIGNGFESEHRLFSHHGASPFSKLRSLVKCSMDDSVRRLLKFTQLVTLRVGRIEYQHTRGSAAGLTQWSRKSFAYIQVVAFRSAI